MRVGAVLAGGKSTRMGADKATIDLLGRPMAIWVAEALRDAGAGPVVLAGEGSDGIAKSLGLDLVPDRLPDRGPLGALDALCETFRSDAERSGDVIVMVCPCDVPLVCASDLDALASALDGNRTAAVAIARAGGRLQPLVSAWRPARVADVISTSIASGPVAVRAVLDALDNQSAVIVVDVADDESLTNVNRPDELADLERRRIAGAPSATPIEGHATARHER